MSKIYTVAVAGLGLIGGSLALALLQNTEWRVVGIDRQPETVRAALRAGLAAAGLPEGEPAADGFSPAAQLLGQADLLILALAPQPALDFLKGHAHLLSPGAVVTDVCGVKRQIVSACGPVCAERGLRFIGGHPMAGKERSGFFNADERLFCGASYILTPLPDTDPAALETMKTLAAAVGCKEVTVTTPAHHDRMIAFTSQLPHVLAGAYVKSPVSLQHAGYSAGSYRDVSRVATVDERLWSQLFLCNRDYLLEEIDGLIENLSACRRALAAEDREDLEIILREGRLRKEGIPD
ncbi:MAG: prephenate dehydrogenase/arogenate dehydrogenase family protein [Clostridiales bacterium]|nr:prephenate dehydrogenase/arogenate dehydrogenase family protein [Clostridiales bacterium]